MPIDKEIKYKGSGNPNWKGGSIPLICVGCKKIFFVKPYLLKTTRRFCSYTCFNKNKIVPFGEKSSHWKGGGIKLKCLTCGKTIISMRCQANTKKFCSHQCSAKWRFKGSKNPSWKGGITPERQSLYKTREWLELKKFIYKRDKRKRQRCGISRIPLHTHHLITFANRELRKSPNNLTLLCKPCHLFIHSKKNVDRMFLE